MKLYVNPLSSNARRPRLVAHHLGLAIEEVFVDLAKGEQRTPDYLALNPNGKVPTLVDGDLKLTESYAIMIYLCEKSGRLELYPVELRARTEIHRWLFWAANEWSPTISKLTFEHFVKGLRGLGPADPARVAEGEAGFKALAKVLDASLAGRQYLLGSSLSLADYGVASGLAAAAVAKLPLEGFTNVQAWLERVQALPAWQATA